MPLHCPTPIPYLPRMLGSGILAQAPLPPTPSLEGEGFGYSPVSGSCSRWQLVETDRTVSLQWGGGQRGKI